MLVQNLIINITRKLGLPLRVRSTAAQLSQRLAPYFAGSPHVQGLGHYQGLELASHVCIFLACKFEDIHGHLDKIVGRMENSDLEKIKQLETEILEFLDFRFSFVNVYQCALAFKYMLEKYRGRQELEWESIVEGINRVLCIDIEESQRSRVQELSLSAFDCSEEEVGRIKADVESLDISHKNIERLRKESRSMRLLMDNDIRLMCAVHHASPN